MKDARMLWEKQVVNIYKYAKVLTDSEFEVEWLQAPQTRHLYIMNDSCQDGKRHNIGVFKLLRSWLHFFKPEVGRKWNVLEEVKRSAKTKLSRYVRDPPELIIDWDDKVIRTNDNNKTIELTDWKVDASMGIIIGNSDIPCMDYETNEGRIIIFLIVGCNIKVDYTETEIVVWYKRFKDVTKYIVPSNDVSWNTRDIIYLPETPNEPPPSLTKLVDVSKHDLSKLTSFHEGGLVRINIPKKTRKELVTPIFDD
jgi:hypothetical protein